MARSARPQRVSGAVSAPKHRRQDKASRREDYIDMVMELDRRQRAIEAATAGRDPRGDLEAIKWAARSLNSDMRTWLSDYLARVDPQPGQPADTLLGSMIGLKKGLGVSEPILFARLPRRCRWTTAPWKCTGLLPTRSLTIKMRWFGPTRCVRLCLDT
jgi:hypothetical protein